MDKAQAMKLMAESHRETVKELEKEIERLKNKNLTLVNDLNRLAELYGNEMEDES